MCVDELSTDNTYSPNASGQLIQESSHDDNVLNDCGAQTGAPFTRRKRLTHELCGRSLHENVYILTYLAGVSRFLWVRRRTQKPRSPVF